MGDTGAGATKSFMSSVDIQCHGGSGYDYYRRVRDWKGGTCVIGLAFKLLTGNSNSYIVSGTAFHCVVHDDALGVV